MTIDSQTNFLFVSTLLQDRSQFFNTLKTILTKHKVDYNFLSNTNDIWAVDYMPIQTKLNRFTLFKYEPDYLQNDEFIVTQTDTNSVCKAIGLIWTESKIKIDGGNVIRGKDWVILTDKIFKENPDFKKHELIKELENLFEAKVIIIPQEPNDFTGHADGLLRYYDDETVLINNYRPDDKRDFQKRLYKVLRDQGLRTITIPYNPYRNTNFDMADGLYINYLQMKEFILLPTFEMKEDETAYRQFEQLFSGQTIETIDSREISAEGGVLNCITWNIQISENREFGSFT